MFPSHDPRKIDDNSYAKLKKSIKEFPEMLGLRPIVVDEDMVVLGGNMRLKALNELEIEEIQVIQAKDLTEEQKKEFLIKDNVSAGDWDWAMLSDFDTEVLESWDVIDLGGNFEAESGYDPILTPDTNYSDVTSEEVMKKAQELANKMIKEQSIRDVICPNCKNEFSIEA